MSSLRETKDRIGSVRNTLKITSAMKLVASSKLHKAQKAIESLRPYEQTLSEIYSELAPVAAFTKICSSANPDAPVALLAVSSNNSLCGAFNVNIIKAADEFMHGLGGREVRVFAVGKKIYDAMRKALPSGVEDLSEMLVRPAYPQSSALATRLINAFLSGEYSRVVLIYNSFVSSSVQKVMVENFLPFEPESSSAPIDEGDLKLKYILEPEPVEIATALLPQLLRMKLHAAILDSTAAEQAARTVAMQAASDNGERLLSELTLEYNKGRQEKITNEILDLVGGSAQ